MNIIFILIDSLRYDALRTNADRMRTINALKKLKNTIFYENAISPAGWTLPSMSAIFSGKYPNIDDKVHLNKRLLIHQILSRERYATGYISCNPYFSSGTQLGNNFQEDYYFNRANFYTKVSPQIIFKSIFGTKRFLKIRMMHNLAKHFINKNRKNRFFLYIHYSVHTPYICFKRYKKEIEKSYGREVLKKVEKQKSHVRLFMAPNTKDEEKKCLYRLYISSLLSLDRFMHALIVFLEKRKIIDNTLVILTADHGEHFGEKGVFGHDYTLYEPIIRVPLIVKYPRNIDIKINKSEDIVSTIDIFPTIVDILQLKKSFTCDFDGISLLTSQDKDRVVISERSAHTRHIEEHKRRYKEIPPDTFEKWNRIIFSLRHKNYKFIHSSRGDHEIYDISKDPGELNNMYGKVNLDLFNGHIKNWLLKAGRTQQDIDEEMEPSFDVDMKEQLKGLGYID